MIKFLFTVFSILAVIGEKTNAQSEKMTNQTIVKLTKANIPKSVILAKIQNAACAFDLSDDSLIALQKENVDADVMTAMAKKETPSNDTKATLYPAGTEGLSPSIYYKDGTGPYVQIFPSVSTSQKVGSFLETLVQVTSPYGGLMDENTRVELSGGHASTKEGKNPIFTFIMDTSAKGFNNSFTYFNNVQSPNEFLLVRLDKHKKSRDIIVGQTNNVRTSYGVNKNAMVEFISKPVAKGIFEVTPSKPLPPGEYGFMFSTASMKSQIKIFDFSVEQN